MTKVIFVGGGTIHKCLLASMPSEVQQESFSIRKVWEGKAEFNYLVKSTLNSRYIVFLGFHKESVAANIFILKRLLRALSRAQWKGQFVFFNTHLALPSSTFSGPGRLPPILRWDTYSFIKRLQSRILASYAGHFGITELFLPIVVGPHTQWTQRLQFIAAHHEVRLPDAGSCKSAWLSIDAFSRWFSIWLMGRSELACSQLFIYSKTGTFLDLIKSNYEPHQGACFVITSLKYPYRFSASFVQNLKTMLRHSPLAVFLTIATQIMRRMRCVGNQSNSICTRPQQPGNTFMPDGSEYQFFAQSLHLDSLPIKAKCIESANKPTVCVIGSGHGGALAAIDLARSGLFHIVMVDVDEIAGSFSGEKKLDWMNKGANFNQSVTRALGFGGTSNLWHGVVAKLDETDWHQIDAAAGLEISKEIKEIEADVAEAFGISLSFSSPKNGRRLPPYAEMASSVKFSEKGFLVQLKPLRTKELLLAAKNDGLDIEFICDAVALHLECTEEGDRATRLRINRFGSPSFIHADQFLVATGALETPRLLLQSQMLGKMHLLSSATGCYLMDHPWTVLGEIRAINAKLRLNLNDVASKMGGRFRIGYRYIAAGQSNHCISFKPLFLGEYTAFKEAMKVIISKGVTLKTLLDILRRFKLRDVFSALLLLSSEKFGWGVKVNRALVFAYLEQRPHPNSRVMLTRDYDGFGRFIPSVNWMLGDIEKNEISNLQQELENIFDMSTSCEFFPYHDAEKNLASGAHHAGTARISINSELGVVDGNLKVHGVNNTYVCDGSIFPYFGNANPSFTIACFSLRLSRHLQMLYSDKTEGAKSAMSIIKLKA